MPTATSCERRGDWLREVRLFAQSHTAEDGGEEKMALPVCLTLKPERCPSPVLWPHPEVSAQHTMVPGPHIPWSLPTTSVLWARQLGPGLGPWSHPED